MPIIFTYDIESGTSAEHNRIQSLFERLGWDHLGGSGFRYPKLGTGEQPVEDWFNHVLPALMLFRSYVLKKNKTLTRYSLDVQTSAGFSAASGFGTPPLLANGVSPGDQTVKVYPTAQQKFGVKNLRNWLDGVTYPY